MARGEGLLAPARGVELFVLEDEGVLFSEPRQELHRLNPAATWIWCAVEQGLRPDHVAGLFAEFVGIDDRTAGDSITRLLTQWQECGWLVGPDGAEGVLAPPAELAARTADVAARRAYRALPRGGWRAGSAAPGERSYALLSTAVHVRYGAPEIERLIHPALAHLETAPGGPIDVRLELASEPSGYALYDGAEAVAEGARLEQLAPLVKLHLRLRAIDGQDYALQLHAGAVSDGARCLLFPGGAGSGKTTLVAGLARSGLGYLTDEVVLLDPLTLQARALPLALTLKRGALGVLRGRYPDAAELPEHVREDGERVRYLPPPKESLVLPGGALPVAAVVFPRYAPGEPTALAPLARADALDRLLRECLSLPYALDRSLVARLIGWLRSVPCFELGGSSLDEAVALVGSLAA
jgi:hypothetical protein